MADPVDPQEEAAKRVAERAVGDIANALGVPVDAAAITERAIIIVDVARGAAWKKADAVGQAAADRVVSLDDAIKASKERK